MAKQWPAACRDALGQGVGLLQRSAGPFLLLLAAVLLLQGVGGAWSGEFGGHPDEAGHYVTGLMVRDYLCSGVPEHPMRYAKKYYGHYPKVALGHWPPGFYVMQAVWTIPFSPQRVSVMVFMAVLTALLAVVVYHVARRQASPGIALLCTLLMTALPLVQRYDQMLMTEVPIALFCLLATLSFARFMSTERVIFSVAFGVFASLAILTKGTGLLLALVPPLAIAFARRWRLLWAWRLWLAAGIVLVLCGPWTWLTLDLVKDGWLEGGPSPAFTAAAIPYYAAKLGLGLSPVLAALAILGVFACRGITAGDPGRRDVLSSLGALAAAVYSFHCLVPCGFEARHLIPALPALIVLSATGLNWLQDRLAARTNWPLKRSGSVVVLATVVLFTTTSFRLPRNRYAGYGPVAAALLADPGLATSRFLVSSDARGEGMFISEVARREDRPGHTVLRASKLFGESRWSGDDYRSTVATTAELWQTLADKGVRVVVDDLSVPPDKVVVHHRLLRQALEAHPQRAQRLGTYPITRAGRTKADGIVVYRINDRAKPAAGQ